MKIKHYTILGMIVLLAIIMVSCNYPITGKAVSDVNKKVDVRLPIPFLDATMSPYYVALDKGYYAEQGLDVSLNPGSSETNPVKMVASGADEFGILGGPDTLLVARSKGIPLVAIAVLHRNSDFPVILTLKESGLTKLEDLQGKKIGLFYGHISTDVLHNLLNKYGIKRNEIDVGVDYNQLIAGKVDAQWAFRPSAGITLPSKGYEVNVISPKEYGINTHGLTLFTTEDMVKNHPEIVEKYLKATFKGVQHVIDSPKDGVKSITNRDSKLDANVEMQRIKVYSKLLSHTERYPIGYMDYKMFKETYDRLQEEGVITKAFDVNKAFTTEFIDKIHK